MRTSPRADGRAGGSGKLPSVAQPDRHVEGERLATARSALPSTLKSHYRYGKRAIPAPTVALVARGMLPSRRLAGSSRCRSIVSDGEVRLAVEVEIPYRYGNRIIPRADGGAGGVGKAPVPSPSRIVTLSELVSDSEIRLAVEVEISHRH